MKRRLLPGLLALSTTLTATHASSIFPERPLTPQQHTDRQTYAHLLNLAQHGDAAAQGRLAYSYLAMDLFDMGAPYPAIPGFADPGPTTLMGQVKSAQVYRVAMQRAGLRWLQLSATQHNPFAEALLGTFLFEPTCWLPKALHPEQLADARQAVNLFRHAAQFHTRLAVLGLAEAYRQGRGIEQNTHQAALLYQKADAWTPLTSKHTPLYDLFGNTAWVWNLQLQADALREQFNPTTKYERRCATADGW